MCRLSNPKMEKWGNTPTRQAAQIIQGFTVPACCSKPCIQHAPTMSIQRSASNALVVSECKRMG